MDQLNAHESGLTFPCDYPVKAMGRDNGELAETVWAIVTRHAPETPAHQLRTNQSSQGRYLSVTVTISAQSRDQLDAIYADLQSHQAVLATL
ncbi:MAG: DUF493 domain-containing protein [Spiribacter sp.]|jgi:putative lipoic acid-binding regulatory protein|nr:DUF493 domain-containing protein [Spiribacter sp.]MDR9489530.1 DUF493 domain-containing protein [Spiribacter sp.]